MARDRGHAQDELRARVGRDERDGRAVAVADEMRGSVRRARGATPRQVVRVPLEQARVEDCVTRRRAEAAPVVREHAPAAGELPGGTRPRPAASPRRGGAGRRRRAAGRLLDVERIRVKAGRLPTRGPRPLDSAGAGPRRRRRGLHPVRGPVRLGAAFRNPNYPKAPRRLHRRERAVRRRDACGHRPPGAGAGGGGGPRGDSDHRDEHVRDGDGDRADGDQETETETETETEPAPAPEVEGDPAAASRSSPPPAATPATRSPRPTPPRRSVPTSTRCSPTTTPSSSR